MKKTITAIGLSISLIGFAGAETGFDKANQEPKKFDHYQLGMFVNDVLYSAHDRWRTSSYQRSSYLFAEKDFQNFDHEFRLRLDIMAPANLHSPDTQNDRPYASVIEVGYFRGWEFGNAHLSLGPKVSFITEKIGPEMIQDRFHDAIGLPNMNVDNYRVPESVEIGGEFNIRYLAHGENGYVIPFLEAEFGTRDFVTVGADIVLGQNNIVFLSREETTGFLLFAHNRKSTERWKLNTVLGADYSYVFKDHFLSSEFSNVESEPSRFRLRAAIRAQIGPMQIMFGLSYLSPEFKGQEEGQFVHGLSIDFVF